MPVRHSAIHEIDKKPDGDPAVLLLGVSEQVESQARDDLMSQLNGSYNATSGKGWGFFHAESGAYPFSGCLGKYLAGVGDFLKFSTTAVEHLTKLMEEWNLTTGGHALFCYYQQGLTDYLVIALVQETEAATMIEELNLMTVKRLDLDYIRLAARINISDVAGRPTVETIYLLPKGQAGPEAQRVLPRLYRQPGRNRRPGRNPHAVEGVQPLRRNRGSARRVGPREDAHFGQLLHGPGQNRGTDHARRAVGPDR